MKQLQYKKKAARRVTIKDLADDLGLSVGAVSQALNPRDNINIKLKPETIARVRAHARLLNYRPHAGASSIRSKHFGNIGYMIASSAISTWEPSPQIEAGIHDAALERNFRVTFLRVPSTNAKSTELVSRVFNESHLDALIMVNANKVSSEYERILKENEFPLVYYNHKQDFQSVHCDDITGGRNITEYLLGQGYRKIGYFKAENTSKSQNSHYTESDRYTGYQQAMQNAGQSSSQPYYLSDKGDEAAIAWLKSSDRPEAILCYSDTDANQLGRLAYAAGIRVPDQLAIAGYNDEPSAKTSWVPLTTMHVPYYDMAYALFNKTIEQINMETPQPFASLSVEPTLQVRESTRRK